MPLAPICPHHRTTGCARATRGMKAMRPRFAQVQNSVYRGCVICADECICFLDINACLLYSCASHATCTDEAAPSLNRSCACDTGYAGDGELHCAGLICDVFCLLDWLTLMETDIDYCMVTPCQSNAYCTDLMAPSLSRTCTCNAGYYLDSGLNTCETCHECEIGLTAVNICNATANTVCKGRFIFIRDFIFHIRTNLCLQM